ncbi:MAG: hypothetical protein JW704_12870 [Anaerolineaceae bacterium]|nr:hypothetical protein [Anaerolineaceae bacterium]MBN2677802.1 hypothetical protein [Anaerolineaceae bacterium]
MNPALSTEDHTALWEAACQRNGFNCLPIYDLELVGLTGNIFIFDVRFQNPDGGIFHLGPCCGEDPSTIPPQAVFSYRVLELSFEEYVVLDLPVYSP